jgi:hypothetical protein
MCLKLGALGSYFYWSDAGLYMSGGVFKFNIDVSMFQSQTKYGSSKGMCLWNDKGEFVQANTLFKSAI